jgi:hypothetical protein
MQFLLDWDVFGADCKRHKIRRFNLIVYLFHDDYVQPEVT